MSAKWDIRYLDVAKLIATWSRDPSTKVGAVVVGQIGEILATGYNGFSRGIHDTESRYEDREQKYDRIVHAEMNCIYNATHNGVALKDSTLYIHGLPVCHECAKGVIQVGIKRVVMPWTKPMDEIDEKWVKSYTKTLGMFQECGIESTFVTYET